MYPKQKRIQNKKYLDWIKECPCIACGRPAEPHHVSMKGHGSMASKTDDTRTIPLCHYHHQEAHSIGRETFATLHYIDYEEVIERLNALYGRNTMKNWMIDVERKSSQIRTFHIQAETEEEAVATARRHARTSTWDKDNNTEYIILSAEDLNG